jgi:hypothetical protein
MDSASNNKKTVHRSGNVLSKTTFFTINIKAESLK